MDMQRFHELMGKEYTRPSTAQPRPVDEEGIPFLNRDEVSSFFGVHPDTVKKWTQGREIPHYVEQKGMGRRVVGASGRETDSAIRPKADSTFEKIDTMQRGTRTWFRHSDIVTHLQNIGHIRAVDAAKHLDMLRGDIETRRRAGETISTLSDNKNLQARLIHFPAGRQSTESGTPPNLSRGESFTGAITSNVSEAFLSGSGRPVAHETPEEFKGRTGL